VYFTKKISSPKMKKKKKNTHREIETRSNKQCQTKLAKNMKLKRATADGERQRDSSFAKLRRRDSRDSVRCQELVGTTEPIPVGNLHSKRVGGVFRAKIAISWIDRIWAFHFFKN
jgi:hypothetical protein